MNRDRKIRIIEPFLIIMESRLKNFEKIGGSMNLDDRDIGRIFELFKEEKEESIVLIDFTPFSNLGTKDRYKKIKELLGKKKNVRAVVRNGPLVDRFKESKIPLLVCDENFKITESFFSSDDMKGKNYFELHKEYVEKRLIKWIKKTAINAPKGKWIELGDGRGANRWLNLKGIIEEPKNLLFIGYQMGYLLTNAYSNNLDEDGFIASNNHAWILASLLSRIFEKELYIVDHLGPSPRINTKWLEEIKQETGGKGKKLVIVEDVISTGRELDLLYFFLNYIGVGVKKVITFLNLEEAKPKLFNDSNDKRLISLCIPFPVKIRGYKQIPKYEYDEKVRL